MYLLASYPLQSILLFIAVPAVLGMIGFKLGGTKEMIKAALIGLAIEVPILCFILWGFSAM